MDWSNQKKLTASNDLKKNVEQLTNSPGVYRMLGSVGKVLYVGKAKNLKKRVKSYFSNKDQSPKTKLLMSQVVAVEVTLTETESEALLLEANLIKELKPRYNVLLRDDKSYPFLTLSIKDKYPRLDIYRGKPGTKKMKYFGPYPNTSAVRDSLNFMQKVFKVRQCNDVFFANRTRPCLQYQINRCTAPCVNYVSQQEYQGQVAELDCFMQGDNESVVAMLEQKMQQAAAKQDYESASVYRDKISSIRAVQVKPGVLTDAGDVDVFHFRQQHGMTIVSVLFVRQGRVVGHKSFFPRFHGIAEIEAELTAFILQYYGRAVHQQVALNRVIVNLKMTGKMILQQALQSLLSNKVMLSDSGATKYAAWKRIIEKNACYDLAKRLNTKLAYEAKFSILRQELGLDFEPTRIECFDVSHTQGVATVASCVVFTPQGADKGAYRRFLITGVTPGDDYSAMYQALERHYIKNKQDDLPLPDLLLVDGGKGQLTQAREVFESLQLADIPIVAIAKGAGRKPGLETLFLSWRTDKLNLMEDSAALHLLQQVRDEAHRFAITAHRNKRQQQQLRSKLETIPGIGSARRAALLTYFGGFQSLAKASAEDIAKVPGISKKMSVIVYAHLHGEDR
jgi:excinuclease ABC subunit C